MNVSYGIAVEWIIFITSLVKNEIRVMQAALVGSILANFLVILSMAFLVGGLQYCEEVYDSLVTQKSNSLLALAFLSLLIPVGMPPPFQSCYTDLVQTACHASSSDLDKADERVLKLSRGT